MKPARQLLTLLAWALLVASRSSCGADAFAEATAGHERVITADYFGIHFHRLVVQPQEDAVVTRWPALKFGSLRLWDAGTSWADVTPRPGEWKFGRMDTYVDAARAYDASVLYTLGSTPRWASARPDERCPYGYGCAAEAVRPGHWEEYVRRVAGRYKGSIEAYELWNEPDLSDLARDRVQPMAFYSGSLATLVDMARRARAVLDEVSPRVILTTPGFVNGPDRLDMFLSAGGKAYVQAVSYHFYAKNLGDFIRHIGDVRAVMQRNGVAKLPLWNTESGVEVYPDEAPLPSGKTERLTRTGAAARMAQFLIVGAAVGLDRYYYYAWDNTRSGMVTNRGERLPAYEAMARVQDWLIGSTMKGCISPRPGTVQCRVDTGGERFLIAWSDRQGDRTLALPVGTSVSGAQTLLSDTPPPGVIARGGMLHITLGAEPVRIALDRPTQP